MTTIGQTLGFEKNNRGRNAFLVGNALFMIIFVIMMVIPLIKVLSDSFDGVGAYGMHLLPQKATLAAYEAILSSESLYRPFFVSLLVTGIGTAVAMTVTTMSAYVLTERDLPGRNFFIYMLLFTMIFNGGLIPTYMQIRRLGLLDSIWSVILTFSVEAYYLILIKNFFAEVPESLKESAEIDGANPLTIFARIMLPLSKPAIAAVSLFYIVLYYNDFFHFIIYINDPKWMNFQVKLRELVLTDEFIPSQDVQVFPKSLQNAAIVIATVPVLIVYPVMQKHFVSGLKMGGVKG
jgi:putative aldouronate transport system permease protein